MWNIIISNFYCRRNCKNNVIKLCWCMVMTALLVSPAIVYGATNPADDNSEYFFACSGGDLEKFKSQLDKNPSLAHKTTKDGEHCLHLCALSGNADIVKILLDVGADPDIRTSFDKGMRMHPLSWNTFYGRHDIIELLLEASADVNADFDIAPNQKGTVLDVIEQILLGDLDGREDKEKFIKTRNVLVKNGALRYASIGSEETEL